MASFIYNSCLYDALTGAIDFDTDTFYMMLVNASYAANKDTHLKRSDVTNEISGTGYTAGGTATTVSVGKDVSTDRITINFAATSWPVVSLTAFAAVVYKRRGGAASADELIAYIDFGGGVTATGGTFSVGTSTLTLQN